MHGNLDGITYQHTELDRLPLFLCICVAFYLSFFPCECVCVCLCVSHMTNSIRFNFIYGIVLLYCLTISSTSYLRLAFTMLLCVYIVDLFSRYCIFFLLVFFFSMSFCSWRFHRTCLFTFLFYFIYFFASVHWWSWQMAGPAPSSTYFLLYFIRMQYTINKWP